MADSTPGAHPLQLLRRLSTALLTDLGEGTDLLEITFALVLRNLVKNFKQCGSRAYPFLKIIVPYIVLLAGAYGISPWAAVGTATNAIASVIMAPFTAQIVVPARHPLNKDVLAWLAVHGLAENSRSLTLTSNDVDHLAHGGPTVVVENFKNPSVINYIPDFGKYRFRFNGHFMTMERRNPREDAGKGDGHQGPMFRPFDPTEPQALTLECYLTLRGITPIKEFLDHVDGFADPPKANTTSIYRLRDATASYQRIIRNSGTSTEWVAVLTRPARCLDSVALEAKVRNKLVRDITRYLTPAHQRFCANRGYPYRFGMLLYGPPGTGKTSSAVALAGHFDLDVYVLSLSDQSLTDQRLETSFAALPNRCILLLEDIDSSGIERESIFADKQKLRKRKTSDESANLSDFDNNAGKTVSLLTLSGLLNCLDGPMSRGGRILCMTTNDPDSLDKALVRTGRCDRKILFSYVTEEIAIQLFQHMYTRRPDELVDDEADTTEQHDIHRLARTFAAAIPPDGKISPAEVQGYLMEHYQDPQAAVDGAEDFARSIIEIKAEGKNVASFMNEVGNGAKTE